MFFEPSGFSNAVSDGVQNNPTSLEKETFDIRDLRPLSKDPESSGPIVLLVGTDTGEDEEYYGDYSTEGLIFPRYAEATEYLMKGDVYLQNDANYEDYRDYLFATDYGGDDDNGLMEGDRSNEGLLINNILVDDTKWAWKTPGLSDDEDVDISIHGNKYVLQHPSLIKSYYTVQGSAKRLTRGCVNSLPVARGSQEAGFTQPRARLLADPCISLSNH